MQDLDSQHTPQEHGAGTYKQHIKTMLGLFFRTVKLLCVSVISILSLHDGIYCISGKFCQVIQHLQRPRSVPVSERLSARISWRITGSHKLNSLQFHPSLV